MNFYNIETQQKFIVWLGGTNGIATFTFVDPTIEFIYTL